MSKKHTNTALTFDKEPIVDEATLEFLTRRIETLTSLLARMVETSGEKNANGQHAKDRCWDCAPNVNHFPAGGRINCPCVCHEVRAYLTDLANER